ncbi:hypothetical protein G6F56_009351 [Rhizopus delemar]|nr:hypothetical protein G6F56_009351 [Rhizopus delemar]
MAPQFENDNFLGLPMKENVKWNCVDVNDVINAVYILMHRGMGNKVTHDKKLYQFTSSRTMTPRDMVREISEGLGRSDLKFEEVPVKDMKDYLMRMKNDHRFKERHGQCEEHNRWDHDGPWSIPIGKYLNSWSIEMIVECMRLANDSKQDICTDDLKKILSAEPRDLKHYFKNNSNQFKQFK